MAISLGLPPDADPADVMLVERGEMGGLQPAKRVADEYRRTWNVLQAQEAKRKAQDAPP